VLVLSFLLLMVVFRSLLVPLKAVVMNLLSIGAAYGVSWPSSSGAGSATSLGVQPGPIEPFMPMMLFAIVFGLSMDYEVFLLSRIKEEYDRTGDSTQRRWPTAWPPPPGSSPRPPRSWSWCSALPARARPHHQAVRLGLAVAVFLDATVVRMLLVPATMELLGDRNWWLPRWLDRSCRASTSREKWSARPMAVNGNTGAGSSTRSPTVRTNTNV
jgi:putative drug exporter of the RND superfamily